ncbi:MAG: hypothetical protein MJ071_00165 [Oscillospiraceae bacterium]|nr:hypothetical protein [Oscillospiraceae bacterium]
MLNTNSLSETILLKALSAEDDAFELTEVLGTVQVKEQQNEEGEWIQTEQTGITGVSQNADAVRGLRNRFPELKITYPQTILSEQTMLSETDTIRLITSETKAVIQVPKNFVEMHSGTAFRNIIQSKWQSQLETLVKETARRLERYEMKTARMFGRTDEAFMILRVTEEYVETDIWALSFAQCELHPLQWDGEVCGMAMLLRDALQKEMAERCGDTLQITIQRDTENKNCRIRLQYTQQD